jgi:glutamate-1-semialdehyde 2,1-aminomutase
VARAFTGRSKIAKFEGAYHGTHDWVLVSVSTAEGDGGSRKRPKAVAWSAGVPAAVLKHVVVLPWNDLDACVKILEKGARDLAALIIDPLLANAGMIPAQEGFLEGLREATARLGILLIFDEVISLRVGYDGAQARYGGEPDLTTMGKIIGGGFPVGATGGRREVMAVFDPGTKGPRVAAGGTFSGNPISMIAGLAAMTAMDRAAFARLETMGARVRGRLNELLQRSGQPGQVTGDGSLFRFVMVGRPLRSYRDVVEPGVAERQMRLFMALLDAGIMVNSNGLACLSTPMGDAELAQIEAATERALAALAAA